MCLSISLSTSYLKLITKYRFISTSIQTTCSFDSTYQRGVQRCLTNLRFPKKPVLNWCPAAMLPKKMKLSEKNTILSQVSEVLSQCQFLIKSLAKIDVIDDIQSNTVKMIPTKSSSSCRVLPNVQNSCHEFFKAQECEDEYDKVRKCEDEYDKVWESEEREMFDTVPAVQKMFDTVPVERKMFDTLPVEITTNPAAVEVTTRSAGSVEVITRSIDAVEVIAKSTDVLGIIPKTLDFLSSTFPELAYNKDWKKINVWQVFGDLSSICHNALVLFTDVSPEVPAPVTVPEVVYPSIDWGQVNTRNLSNLPVPDTHAIHGCSQDPSHYEKKQVQGYNRMEWRPSQFEQNYPFGHLPGFLTDMGVIAFSPEVIHGHVWDVKEHKWVLHASVKKVEDRQWLRQEERHKRWRPGERQQRGQKG